MSRPARSDVARPAPGGVAFVADRVMHYHVPTMRAIEARLAREGIPFSILSSLDDTKRVGRVAVSDKVVSSHLHFRLSERKVGSFMLRQQHGLIDLLEELAPRVVMSMCHSGTFSEWAMLRWAGRLRLRRVAWQCGYEYNPVWIKRVILDRFVPLFDFHLCYHSNAQRYAIQHGAKPGQTLVMNNTIDESRIVAGAKGDAKRLLVEKWPQAANKKIVLYVGAVLEEKRLDDVFAALDLLDDPDVFFVLVGNGDHLPELKARYGSRRNWLSTGAVVDGVGLYFDAADVFVLPGTGGLAINEAMAHRLPVVSGYADGSADDLVVDGETGFRLSTGAPAELADKLKVVLGDPQLADRMGRAGEARIRGPLSFQSFVDKVVRALMHQHEIAGGGTLK